MVSLELNTKQKTKSVECYIPLGFGNDRELYAM